MHQLTKQHLAVNVIYPGEQPTFWHDVHTFGEYGTGSDQLECEPLTAGVSKAGTAATAPIYAIARKL